VFAAAVTSGANAYLGGPNEIILLAAVIGAAGALWAAVQAAAKSEEIASLHRRVAETVTGGDAWCHIVLSPTGRNDAVLTVVHQGEYPLYDVTARVVDLDEFDSQREALSFEQIAEGTFTIDIGNLAPNSASLMGHWTIPDRELRWNIFFAARNGFFTQELRVRRVGDALAHATRITRRLGAEQEVVREDVTSEFPRGADGEVEW
jgi:hypothetical protein